MKFKNEKNGFVVITGASEGIGKEFAFQLTKMGVSTFLVARSEAKLKNLAAEIKSKAKTECEYFATDLSTEEGCEALLSLLNSKKVLGLINNAGFGSFGKFEDGELKQSLNMIALNVQAPLILTHRCLAGLRRSNGFVLNVASTAGFSPVPMMAVYAATKAFLLNWSEAIQAEVVGSGVQIFTLCPGPTQTEFFNAAKMSNKAFRMKYQTASEVVKEALSAIAEDRTLHVSGWFNRSLIASGKLIPRKIAIKTTLQLLRQNSDIN